MPRPTDPAVTAALADGATGNAATKPADDAKVLILQGADGIDEFRNRSNYSMPFACKAALAAGVARNFTNATAPSRLAGAAEGAAA
jgi:hypothetical protein